ncbi:MULTISPECIES: glutamine-hydrolyzing carbamoyl-phosphate synthase small subunit [Micrococcus]|jgi:carbamoyl-phosphate synthase small subunit|uniref:Carbamoyl phosphate synthase small chain n=2 Tax=Micrococcus TaxID=1269 RepID=C5CCF2_MICLC|nr:MULTISPECIES: glutamine-hydrolyzing carbamoyl-phosphate synthase small subunit [Micrococcus]TFI17755.1 carbamoyl-phosphate synthase small subunit [Thiopseudomonas sp. 4R-3cl]ACS30764.1 carbamoyl-phosphate synthase small subunit [Micrococcus luteus NCTC 2665]AJO55857.1 carbamoyl phosphate synthase small subunit [Micrococcus luteus]KAB1903696.1 glutamine-hydrolyzing carbamoyl-phosphate synthase small subunit [Micrococcus luteus NCTC 2665]MBA9058441.1 carbamoyl-phosphate synthase small subunit
MSTPTDDLALLVLEDGTVHRGRAYGARGRTLGEAVFTTGMTGYQETLTDPSYAGQIIVQTSPHIGNTGVNDADRESWAIFAAGYVVRDAARRPSNWRAERTLDEELEAFGVVGIREVDTRAITRRLRTEGSMRAGVFSGEHAARPEAELLAEVRAQPSMAGARLAESVTTEQPYVIEPAEHGWEGEPIAEIAALDLGIKAATPRHLASRGIRVHVLPAATDLAGIRAVDPDGVFLSNGPGDPATADAQVELLREVLDAGLPFFGICFGNQIFGRALGFDTYKLKFGHRGPNQPVLDKATGRVAITSQNHGFAVDAPLGEPIEAPESRFGRVEVSHWSLNDQVVEGLRLLDRPAFSVQFHPESAAGPNDTLDLFDRFVQLLTEHRAATTPATEGA